MDPRIERLAALLLDYSLDIREGQTLMLNAPTVAEPLVQALTAACAQRGVYMLPRLRVEDSQFLTLSNATDSMLEKASPIDMLLFEHVDAMIGINATTNPKELSRVDPAKMAKFQGSMRPIYDILNRREMAGEFTWVGAPYPTAGMAADAQMSTREYTDFVFMATACHLEDPTAHWTSIHKAQEEIVQQFNGSKELHIFGPETDLRFNIEGRTWVNCSGKKNMPDGEIFTSPVEDSAEGTIYFDYPANYRGVEVEGVRLTLKEGKVVEATAQKGQDYLLRLLDSDEGARLVGEVAIGTNFSITSPSKSILFDEKIGGSMHMAVGMSIPEAGGKNQSGLHWDMIKDMRKDARWELDGKVVYENGVFKI